MPDARPLPGGGQVGGWSFLGLGPTFELGSAGVRLAAAARAAIEYRVNRGLRLRFEGRGLIFAAGRGAGDAAVLALLGPSAGGQR